MGQCDFFHIASSSLPELRPSLSCYDLGFTSSFVAALVARVQEGYGSLRDIMLKQKVSFRSLPRNLILAIFILFSLFILVVTLVFVQIIVPGAKVTNNQFKVGYNIATTLIATLIANYVRGEIQRQWLRYINHEISDVRYQASQNPSIAPRWRAVLGINTIDERIRTISTTGLTQVSFIATGLLVTSIVTAVTLQDVTCSAAVDAPRIHSGADSNCAKNVPNQNIERLSPLWEFRTFWGRSDGSAYYATTNLGCPSWSGAQFMGSINTENATQYAYARSGVAVDRSAIGAPEIFYTQFPSPDDPGEPFSHPIQPGNLRSVSQCLPVMASNPIKCTRGGTLTSTNSTEGNGTYRNMNITAGGCQFDQMNYEDPKSPFGIMVARLCTSNSTANNTVGQGTIAIGATNIMSLTLAAAMGDTAYLKENGDKYESIHKGDIKDLSYVLSCTVDVQPSIQWRTLNLTLKDSSLSSSAFYSKRVTGVEGCNHSGVPGIKDSDWALGDGYAAGAVAALVRPLSEGRYWNGMPNTILNQALNVTDTSERYSTAASWQALVRRAPFGFSESTNALEDVLGLTTAITMSQMSTTDSQSPGSPLADSKVFRSPVKGQATFACTRVGPGQRYALVFCLPSMVAMVMACYLLWVTPASRTAYKTSRLEDLIAIGMASERELIAAYKADRADEMRYGLMHDAQGFGMRKWPGDRSSEEGYGMYSRSETPVGWNNGLFPPPAEPSKGSGQVK